MKSFWPRLTPTDHIGKDYSRMIRSITGSELTSINGRMKTILETKQQVQEPVECLLEEETSKT